MTYYQALAENGVAMAETVTGRGAISQLGIMAGWTHGDPRFGSTQTTPALDFLDLYLEPRPTLRVIAISENLEISWPSSATGCGLQWTSDLLPSNTWASATNAATSNNGTTSVGLPFDFLRQFFRLAK